MSNNMKYRDFTPYDLCGREMMHAGHSLFLRISVDRLGVNARAFQRAHSMELILGGNALLANNIGADKDLAKVIDGRRDMLICIRCASEPLAPYFWLDEGEEELSTKGSATA
jgi:hypothetical protein